ncbi:hypothetical protein PRMUPPPA20_07890 [Xylanibacter ruminicola]|uniref:Conserved domain protein n=2 Tax=Xylanibacter ruminicola TaxID=839 RepID=D5EWB1_XYLR2|nr:DUF6055 domain-containing protein [Xylanibacter ruminicola]ADE82506.1 conserved domain protein [Xylanibacter ruminicola 23]GJG32680.1 hypothetical protein PRMUPPPA20_07890 [Xylanibacter ruminicola]SEH96163.1 Putative binding domain-containing protein, N-terminal [Xylanibacter ruminicola]
MKRIFRYFFLLLATATIAACSSSDDTEPVSVAPTLSETEVNVEYDVTWYSLTVTSRAVWSAKVENGGDWLTLKDAKGVGGSEKLSFEMKRNTTKQPRVANITVTSGTASTNLKVTQGPTTIEIMDQSQVKDFDKYYKPKEFNFDMLRNDAKWSWFRSKQSEHFFVFWDAYFGDDPNSSSLAEGDRVDVDDLLQKAEQFYKTNIDRLGMVVTGQGKSYLDQYKMEIYLLDPTPEWWVATGSGYDDVIGALWVTPSTCKPVGSVIGHEIGHSFQYQTYCDNVKNGAANDFKSGFRYGYEGSNGGCGFWEQCAQWQSYQDYPQQALNDDWNAVWYQQCHRHFEHEWQRYASYYLQYYWTELHGDKTLGRIWNESKYPEDASGAYMRIFGVNYENYKKQLFAYAQRCVTFDFDGTRSYFTNQNTLYKTTLYNQDGYYQIGYEQCPQPTGFNVINLEVPAAGTKVTVSMEALKAGSKLPDADPGNQVNGDFQVVGNTSTYNKVGSDQAIAYGFVALKEDGSRDYSEMSLTDAKGTAVYTVPAKTKMLYLVVQGAPKSYRQCPWDDKEETDMQCPYRFKIDGTDLYGNFSIDETKDPADVAFTFDVKCNAASEDYIQGSIQLQGSDLKKMAQAFVMQPSVLSGATLPIAAGQTAEPAEGKVALGLIQSDGKITYQYTANVGFWCNAKGDLDNWGDTAPVYVEYDKDSFTLTYGHRFGVSKVGEKYTLKPVLVYTKGGKQYKATFTLNMQF